MGRYGRWRGGKGEGRKSTQGIIGEEALRRRGGDRGDVQEKANSKINVPVE